MKVYGVDFKIEEKQIDRQKIESIPGEGVIMPLLVDMVPGFYDYLIRNKCISNRKPVEMIYIFLVAETWDGILSVQYTNGDVSAIQNIGEIDICHRYIK